MKTHGAMLASVITMVYDKHITTIAFLISSLTFNPPCAVLFICVKTNSIEIRKDENRMANPNPVRNFHLIPACWQRIKLQKQAYRGIKARGLGEEEFLDAFIRTSIRMTEENPTQGVQMLKEIFLRISPSTKSMHLRLILNTARCHASWSR